MAKLSPARRLDGLIARFTPEIAGRARATLKKMRAKLPNAHLLVYDNYNTLAIGFAPSERASEGIFSVAVYPRWINLFFLQGARLKDPKKLLKGDGAAVRRVLLSDAAVLDDADVAALMDQALKSAKVPLDANAKGEVVIKSISKRQRPRRP
jgi:hypothetical protein